MEPGIRANLSNGWCCHETFKQVKQQLILLKWNGPFSRVIYIGDPELILKITTENWPKPPEQYDGFRPLSGDALFVQINHERWRTQRKHLAPAFQPQIINAQYPCFAKYLSVRGIANYVEAVLIVCCGTELRQNSRYCVRRSHPCGVLVPEYPPYT
jgi:hypothetical protein